MNDLGMKWDRRPIFLAVDDLEVVFQRINDLNDGGASLVFKLHRDDASDDLWNAMRKRKGKRFKLAMVQIGDDEHPVPQPAEEESESTLNSGDNSTQRQPASVTGEPPARAIHRAYSALGGRRRGDRGYQNFMFDVVAPIIDWKGMPAPLNDQARRREQMAELQHLYCRVASLKDIEPNTEASLRFELLETAFDAEDRGLDPTEILIPNEKEER